MCLLLFRHQRGPSTTGGRRASSSTIAPSLKIAHPAHLDFETSYSISFTTSSIDLSRCGVLLQLVQSFYVLILRPLLTGLRIQSRRDRAVLSLPLTYSLFALPDTSTPLTLYSFSTQQQHLCGTQFCCGSVPPNSR